jgi:hypothetical protein
MYLNTNIMNIPICMVGISDEKDLEYIENEIETILVKDIIDKVIYKDYYCLIYFHPTKECIDFRISRFIKNIQSPEQYIILNYKNKMNNTKICTYIKKAPYKMLI